MPESRARKVPAKRSASRRPVDDPALREVQAVAEGVVVPDDHKVTLKGASFRMADSIGMMPLLRFAHASKQGVDSADMAGLAAMYDVIADCIDQDVPQRPAVDAAGARVVDGFGNPVLEPAGESEWDRFQRHAIDTKASAEELLQVVTDCIQVLSARPTPRPGDSPAGPQTTGPSSKTESFERNGTTYYPVEALLDR